MTVLVAALDSDTVNGNDVAPELPSAAVALAIDTVGVDTPALAMALCHLAPVLESSAMMLLMLIWLSGTPESV